MSRLGENIEKLEKNPAAKLRLARAHFGDEGAQQLAAAMTEYKASMTGMDLQDNGIGSGAGLSALIAAFGNNFFLVKVNLWYNNLGDAGVLIIADFLKSNPCLEHLNIGNNNIGDEGAKRIASALEYNSNLNNLEIAANKIGEAGGLAFANVLEPERNSTLTSLNICDNKIGEAGGLAFANVLEPERNSTLTSLSISRNNIGEAGGLAFAGTLERNSTLVSLSISVSSAIAMTLVKALEHNYSLTDFQINEIDNADVIQLIEIWEHNIGIKKITSNSLVLCGNPEDKQLRAELTNKLNDDVMQAENLAQKYHISRIGHIIIQFELLAQVREYKAQYEAKATGENLGKMIMSVFGYDEKGQNVSDNRQELAKIFMPDFAKLIKTEVAKNLDFNLLLKITGYIGNDTALDYKLAIDDAFWEARELHHLKQLGEQGLLDVE